MFTHIKEKKYKCQGIRKQKAEENSAFGTKWQRIAWGESRGSQYIIHNPQVGRRIRASVYFFQK
jgi:hypothetical protein